MSTKSHPAEVTARRLLAALDKWPDRFHADERDAIGKVINALDEIADGTRSDSVV